MLQLNIISDYHLIRHKLKKELKQELRNEKLILMNNDKRLQVTMHIPYGEISFPRTEIPLFFAIFVSGKK